MGSYLSYSLFRPLVFISGVSLGPNISLGPFMIAVLLFWGLVNLEHLKCTSSYLQLVPIFSSYPNWPIMHIFTALWRLHSVILFCALRTHCGTHDIGKMTTSSPGEGWAALWLPLSCRCPDCGWDKALLSPAITSSEEATSVHKPPFFQELWWKNLFGCTVEGSRHLKTHSDYSEQQLDSKSLSMIER